MSWHDDYRARLCTADEAVARIQSGHNVFYSGNAAIPRALIDALARRAPLLEDVRLTHLLLLGDDPLSAPGMEKHVRHHSLFVGSADREAVNEGRADYVPIFLHQIPRLFEEGIFRLDVAMVQVSPPDAHGFMSFGVEVLASKAACRSAKVVIAQVNDRMPRVLGDAFVHVSRIDAFVEHSAELPTLGGRPSTETELSIGRNIVGLIEDGATMQMGIGGIPDAVYESLEGIRDLGIHTEMISDGAMRAIERGIITGNAKTLHPGKAVITFALGSERLYRFLDNNAMIEAHPAEYVNDPAVASQNDKLVAVNSAIEIDLTGQVCSDSIGTYIYSGFGGQVDFIRAAARSRRGKPGAGVVTSRADVHYVVTEHGIAHLFGRNLRERAEALIGIAAPQFRDDLTRAAKERRLLP